MREENGMKSIVCAICAIIVAAIEAVAANPTNIIVPSGYTITAVATGLNFPTAISLQGDSIWVAEGGTSPRCSRTRILRPGPTTAGTGKVWMVSRTH